MTQSSSSLTGEESNVNDNKDDHETLSHRHVTKRFSLKSIREAARSQYAEELARELEFTNQRELILVIRGIVERVALTEDLKLVLGRSNLPGESKGTFDLSPYGGLDRGVSRRHASIHIQENSLYITDLGSTNGTYLAGNRLQPNQPTLLKKGDELMLGRLPIQILFR